MRVWYIYISTFQTLITQLVTTASRIIIQASHEKKKLTAKYFVINHLPGGIALWPLYNKIPQIIQNDKCVKGGWNVCSVFVGV